MAGQHDKVLRIGVIQAGKIVEERVLPARQPITVGTAARNTIVVPHADVPESTLVFAWQGDRYVLQFDAAAEGRIQGPQGSADLAALVSQGVARQAGRTCSVPVNDDQRGKLAVGELTLLWQFVAPPAEVPKPELPKEARGGHFKSMDRLFTVVLAVSFLVHSGAYIALANTELPSREVTLEEIPDRYAKVLIPERMPRPPEQEKKEEKKVEAPVEKEKKVEKADEKKADAPEQVAQRKAARAAAVAKAVQSKGLLKVLGALGPGSSGGAAVADVFGASGGMGDVASALSGAGGVAVATDPGAGAGRKGGGQGGTASIGSLATAGGGKVALGAKTEVKVAGSVAAEEAEVDSSDIDQGKLSAFVRARMGLIKACYENALKRNPALKGKIVIRFTILGTGALADINTAQNSLGSAEVGACIVNTMRSWRTQFRPSGPATVEYPFVFQPVN
jgi:TonB family protein